MSVALGIQRTKRMRHITLSSVACLSHTIFFHIILLNGTIFEKKKKLLNIKCKTFINMFRPKGHHQVEQQQKDWVRSLYEQCT